MPTFSTKIDPYGLITSDIAKKSELRLDALKEELAKKFNEASPKTEFLSGLGGDPFFYYMMVSDPHAISVDGRLFTAATSGNQYFWNPYFIDVLSPAGLRFVLGHEIAHTFLNHVPRMKDRHPTIHNWCVDFFANNLVIADLRQRFENLSGLTMKAEYKDYLDYYKQSMHCTKAFDIARVKAYMLDPVGEAYSEKDSDEIKIKLMIEDNVVPHGMRREATFKSNQEIAYSTKNNRFEFFFERAIPETMKTPEALYDELTRSLKKCPNCNRVGMFPVPNNVRTRVSKTFKSSKVSYPSAESLIDCMLDIFKKNKIVLAETGNEVSDEELTNDRRFLNTIQGQAAVDSMRQQQRDLTVVDSVAAQNKPIPDPEVVKAEHEAYHKALDEFFEKAQDLFYEAVKKSVFFDHAKVPDQLIKEGRANPQYNKHFLKAIIGFVNYLMSELDVIQKNRSLDQIFDVLKKSIVNTQAGYYLIKAKTEKNLGGQDMRKEIKKQRDKDIADGKEVSDEEDTSAPYDPVTSLPDSENRVFNTDSQMFDLIKKNNLSILQEFDLWGGYSDYLDSMINPDWVNMEALDCPECCHKIDMFKFNKSKMIYHPGSGENEEDQEDIEGDGNTSEDKNLADAIAKNKLMNALLYAKQAGYVPAGFEEAIGRLQKSKMRWQDNIRTVKKDVEDNGRNDWSRFKSKQIMMGLLTPKKVNKTFKVAVLCDTSGSMNIENDITFGISQLTNLTGGSGYLTWADAEIYWDQTIKLDRFSKETLSGVKCTGRGGTEFLSYFNDYKKKLKDDEISMIVVITDGFLYNGFQNIKDPRIPVMWLITNHGEFSPPFGKVFNIHND